MKSLIVEPRNVTNEMIGAMQCALKKIYIAVDMKCLAIECKHIDITCVEKAAIPSQHLIKMIHFKDHVSPLRCIRTPRAQSCVHFKDCFSYLNWTVFSNMPVFASFFCTVWTYQANKEPFSVLGAMCSSSARSSDI